MRWIRISYHSAENFQRWNTILSQFRKVWGELQFCLSVDVEKFVVWIRILYHIVKNFERWRTILSLGRKFVKWITFFSQCRKFWDKTYNFVSHCRKLCEVNYNFISQCRKLCGVPPMYTQLFRLLSCFSVQRNFLWIFWSQYFQTSVIFNKYMRVETFSSRRC